MMMDSFLRAIALVVLLLTLPLTAAQAQGEQSVPVVAPDAPPPTQAQSMPPEPDSEVTILRDDYAGAYNPSTLKNLSQLYWRLGAFDFQDNQAVGDYLRINECQLYTDYLHDDLEWKEILNATRTSIRKKRDTYPINFQFVLQLHLGRYDTARGGFPIVDNTGFKNSKRIEVDSIDRSREICHNSDPLEDYPKSLTILLAKPFTLDFIKLNEHVAQAYILRKKSEFSQLDEDQRLQAYEREAYLRLRFTFTQYHGNIKGDRNTMAILYGNLDGYEIFEDGAQKRLMASVDLTKQAEMSMPVEPLSDMAAAPVESGSTTTTTTVTTVVKDRAPVPTIPASGMGLAATPSP